MAQNNNRRVRIKAHIRKKVFGTAERPRLTVFRSNTNIYVQGVDDLTGKTLFSANSLQLKEKAANKSEQAEKVGELVAQKAQAAGISEIVFDRNGYLYHGRVQQLAEGARTGGLKF